MEKTATIMPDKNVRAKVTEVLNDVKNSGGDLYLNVELDNYVDVWEEGQARFVEIYIENDSPLFLATWFTYSGYEVANDLYDFNEMTDILIEQITTAGGCEAYVRYIGYDGEDEQDY